jgi:diaminohydroxyphosphoribosylaminopyrimidine deaminase/5-amino-6-(5-phosphoribosylamino)uracil reductase
MKDEEEKYMRAALKLAERGVGAVEPNPAVGCVIVKNGEVIGKGWHKKFGGPHAEINALADCEKKGVSTKGAVMYVNLEPCCHEGKTGPCTEAIIAAGISKVVVAMLDPSEHTGGQGVQKLSDAGVTVQIGVCEDNAKLLNAPFTKYATTGKCWVILKWAQSIDGKLAYAGEGRWISNELSRKDAHKLRRRAGAIVVGINTVLADDPLLTPRPAKGKKPIRVSQVAIESNLETVEKIKKKGAELLAVPSVEGRCDIGFLVDELSRRGVSQVLVEGGAEVIGSFLKEGLVDEICIYVSPKILGGRGRVEIGQAMMDLAEGFDLSHVDVRQFGGDVRVSGLVDSR